MKAKCAVLHDTARLEEDLYGEVVSPSVAAHLDECTVIRKEWQPQQRGVSMEELDRVLAERGVFD